MTAIAMRLTNLGDSGEAQKSLSAGNIHIDAGRYQAFVGGSPVMLTYQEFELLWLLVAGRDRILSSDELIEQLWHNPGSDARSRLGVVICRLRAKLSKSWPYRIETIRSRGYGLTVPAGLATEGKP